MRSLLFHATRHAYGADDEIPTDALRFAQVGKVLRGEKAIDIDGTTGVTLDKGVWLVESVSGVEIQYTPDGGTTWRTVGGGGLVISDGANVRLYNTGTVAVTVHAIEFL